MSWTKSHPGRGPHWDDPSPGPPKKRGFTTHALPRVPRNTSGAQLVLLSQGPATHFTNDSVDAPVTTLAATQTGTLDLGPRTKRSQTLSHLLQHQRLPPRTRTQSCTFLERTVLAWNSVVAQILRWRRSPTPGFIFFKRKHFFVRYLGCPLVTGAFNRQAEG